MIRESIRIWPWRPSHTLAWRKTKLQRTLNKSSPPSAAVGEQSQNHTAFQENLRMPWRRHFQYVLDNKNTDVTRSCNPRFVTVPYWQMRYLHRYTTFLISRGRQAFSTISYSTQVWSCFPVICISILIRLFRRSAFRIFTGTSRNVSSV